VIESPILGRAHAKPSRLEASLEELLLLVGEDGAVRGRVGHAGEAEAAAHLVVIEERAVRLVNGASGDLARAGRACARAARVRQVNAVLLSLVEHVRVASAVNGRLTAVLHAKRHGEHLGSGRAARDSHLRGRCGEGRGRANERKEERGATSS